MKPDLTFELVAILHRALDSARRAEATREQLGDAADGDLPRLLETVRAANRRIAEQARSLLERRFREEAARLEDAKVEEASEESFPASDAPAIY
jgi:hypothetical protein